MWPSQPTQGIPDRLAAALAALVVTGFGGADTSGTVSAVTGTSSGGVSSGASGGGPDQ